MKQQFKTIYISLILLLFVPSVYGQKEIEDLLIQGIEYHDAGEYQKAIDTYRQLLSIDPENVEAIYEISLSLLEAGDYYTAIEYSDKLLQRDDKYAVLAYNTKGSCLNYLGKSEEAIEVFLEGLEKEEEFYLLHFNLGIAYYANEEYPEARDAFIGSLELNPRHAGAHYNLGRTMLLLNRRVESLLSLNYFLLIEPNSERSLEAYELLLLQLNNPNSREDIYTASDFLSVDKMISQHAGENTDKSDFDKMVDQTDSLFKSFGVVQTDNDRDSRFWWDLYIPFFKSMAFNGYTDVFCRYIRLAVEEIPDPWLKANESRIRSFMAWVRQQ